MNHWYEQDTKTYGTNLAKYTVEDLVAVNTCRAKLENVVVVGSNKCVWVQLNSECCEFVSPKDRDPGSYNGEWKIRLAGEQLVLEMCVCWCKWVSETVRKTINHSVLGWIEWVRLWKQSITVGVSVPRTDVWPVLGESSLQLFKMNQESVAIVQYPISNIQMTVRKDSVSLTSLCLINLCRFQLESEIQYQSNELQHWKSYPNSSKQQSGQSLQPLSYGGEHFQHWYAIPNKVSIQWLELCGKQSPWVFLGPVKSRRNSSVSLASSLWWGEILILASELQALYTNGTI